MIAFLVIVYVAVVLVLFKIMRLKPTAVSGDHPRNAAKFLTLCT
jgi:hypothetical protein